MRLVDKAPPYCSSCFSQKPDQEHVDFQAAFDGPVVERPDVLGAGTDAVAIDDLIICRDCLLAAAGLLPEVDNSTEVDRLRAELDAARGDHAKVTEYASKLEAALVLKPEAEKAKAPRLGRRERSG